MEYINVYPFGDDVTAVQSAQAGTFSALQTLINVAPTDGTEFIIEITSDITFTATLTIASGKNITILSDTSAEGSPFTLIQTIGRHFLFDGRLTLENITLDGSTAGTSATATGGGVRTTGGGVLFINDMAFIQNCYAVDYGGGVYMNNAGSSLTISGGGIIGCTSTNFGGGVYVGAGALTLTGGSISRNTGVRGGGVFAGTSVPIIISGGTIDNNTGAYGGGMYAYNITMSGRASINDNIASQIGGGIWGANGARIIIGGFATIGNNSIALLPYEIVRYGGGIGMDSNTSLTLQDDASVSGCSAPNGGGVSLVNRDALNRTTTMTIKDRAVITSCLAGGNGGGIYLYNSSTMNVFAFSMEGGTINGNIAEGSGGGIYSNNVPLNISGGAITGNTALNDGGGIMAINAVVSIADGEIANNSAGGDGGGIFTNQLANVTVYESVIFSGNIAQTYAFWTVTSGGDSDIHRTHIFTDRFSTFIPSQTPPPEVWSFTNAYNNYDINYVQPYKAITVNFVDVSDNAYIIRQTIIDSFIGATAIIPPRNVTIDINGTVWTLEPPDQPAQEVELTDPEADYIVTFYYATSVVDVIVTEYYINTAGVQIMDPTQTIVEFGGTYSKTAPDIANYSFVGYTISGGPLQAGNTVIIVDISANTVITFVYTQESVPPVISPCRIYCKPIPCKCCFPRCCNHSNQCRCCFIRCCIKSTSADAVFHKAAP